MSQQPAPWARTIVGIFGAEVATDEQQQRHLQITTPDGHQVVYVFTAANAEIIGRQLLAPGVVIPNFPPEK